MKKSSFKNLKTKELPIGDLNRSKGGDYRESDMAKTTAKWWDALEKALS